MSQSTDGNICFGILLDEDGEFPWSERDDIEEWWLLDVCGFKSMYDKNGNYISGTRPPESVMITYYASKKAFEKEHPCPVSLVNVCYIDNPIWIIASNSTKFFNATRGDPTAFEPSELVAPADAAAELLDFCSKYGIDIGEQAPRWYLSSYWG